MANPSHVAFFAWKDSCFRGLHMTLICLPYMTDVAIYRNNFAAPLFSLVATATRASSRPIPESRAEESEKPSDRGSCSA